eukprot:TRINITY_DN22628_c0_g7_i1.p1 TRINITY_DN22628_c0_g7~~TRINITY_DN22628_c0_g7_i1.p1  ORF type:complete len:461 (-),score=56.00 TRINITY_DN22628_c0_g7_i1:93-1475(-)
MSSKLMAAASVPTRTCQSKAVSKTLSATPLPTRAYHPGRQRAKTQLREALETGRASPKLRRLDSALKSRRLDREDPATQQMTVSATLQLHELTARRARASSRVGSTVPMPSAMSIDAFHRGRAPRPASDDFSWLRLANHEPDRRARREVAAATRRAVECRGYKLGSSSVVLAGVNPMLANTIMVSPSMHGAVWPKDSGTRPMKSWRADTHVSVAHATVLETAVNRTRSGRRVVAVNAASAYHVGGGFLTGGRHALEEAMCVQSTLYDSLKKGADLAEAAGVAPVAWAQPSVDRRSGREWQPHLPDDGALLSPHVDVFRGGTGDGYPFEDVAVGLAAVISVAMPNCNDRMTDSPVDAHPNAQEYQAQLVRKWRAVLTAAACFTDATCLVVPDAGCGVFRNPPEQVGAAFGRVLRDEFWGRFDEVLISFPGGSAGETFAAATKSETSAAVDAHMAAPNRGRQ